MRSVQVCYLAAYCGLFLLAGASSPAAERSPSYSGDWTTTFGPMHLEQKADRVHGEYGPSGTDYQIEGDLREGKFQFTYREADVVGEGWFQLAADGQSFDGRWREKGVNAWSRWRGDRTSAPQALGFAGVWQTTFGRMRLIEREGKVTGVYAMAGGSTLEGQREGGIATLSYREPDASGEAVFELSADGAAFVGRWRTEGAEDWSPWTGQRIQPVIGRQYLVVLESRWEGSLADREYAFGDMLKAFFARSPQVEVRARGFQDEVDFRRWCAELAYLAEPIVLVVASHGTAAGLSTSGQVIGPEAIADSLKHAPGVRLLHFSSCLLLEGQAGQEIQQRLGSAAALPVSGYASSVDWAASAVIEFMYLDLIFNKGQTPAEAARQMALLMPFSREEPVPDTVMPSARFRFLPAVGGD